MFLKISRQQQFRKKLGKDKVLGGNLGYSGRQNKQWSALSVPIKSLDKFLKIIVT